MSTEIGEKADTCKVTIKDTGCGIPDNEILNLFEPFFFGYFLTTFFETIRPLDRLRFIGLH